MVIHKIPSVISTSNGSVQSHNRDNGIVNLLRRFSLICLDVSGRGGSDENIIQIPSENRVTTVGYLLLQHQLHQLLGRRTHILKFLSERWTIVKKVSTFLTIVQQKVRIPHAKAPPFLCAETVKSCGFDTRSYSGSVRTFPRFSAVCNDRKIKGK